MATEELDAAPEAGGFELAMVASRSGDEASRRRRLRGMVTKHHATIWRFLRRLGLEPSDADDAIQDVLVVAMRKLDVIEPHAELSYLLRTAYRIGCRLRARRPQVDSDQLVDPIPHPDVLVDQKRARELLDQILARMSDELRAVLVLHDIERLTMADIALALDLRPGTVASRLRRAREDFDQRVARAEARMNSSEVSR